MIKVSKLFEQKIVKDIALNSDSIIASDHVLITRNYINTGLKARKERLNNFILKLKKNKEENK